MRFGLLVRVSLLFLIAACAIHVRPAPAATTNCAATPDSVFFVTDREPASDEQIFTGERGLVKGTNKAIISSGVATGLPVSRSTIEPCADTAALHRALSASFDKKRGRQVLIYIHGYFTPFRDAVSDALKLKAKMNFPGPVVLFSWPSKVTSRLTYVNDETNASWASVHFRVFIAQILKSYPGMPVSFAAHSLGARFATDGMSNIATGPCPKCLGRAVFFAPDVDADAFSAAITTLGDCDGPPPAAPAHAAPVTVYVSNRDKALRLSQQLHGHQRAGQAGNEMLLCKGVDTIDVSYVGFADKSGHSYQVEDPVAVDAHAAFAGVSPINPSRKLKQIARPAGFYYELGRLPKN